MSQVSQGELFAATQPPPQLQWQKIRAQGADLRLCEHFVAAAHAGALFQRLREGLDWQRDEVQVFGKRHPIPRMHQWYADPGADYAWSGLHMPARAWPPELARLRDAVQRAAQSRFNSALANLYRDGRDTMGWHADDERELGPQPVIASLSLGATRDFVLRRKDKSERIVLPLAAGSLLVMAGDTQHNWQHALPKRMRVDAPRINLTFRWVGGGD